ncbi:uncharacterized protein KGF55_000954 [Candida pseudojiufengensis]|uniref:uncharacterized protein n=1 Tax=Candida pseudojiufengensis TaxID=497109 RepID=UPI0022252389|nr:uncharacterized protein KGF55_000954 [Candida pseudojiufengensis]KAI5965592.1 hypothetical protein KGF55_000954 [Candida pseudojiufengensis]
MNSTTTEYNVLTLPIDTTKIIALVLTSIISIFFFTNYWGKYNKSYNKNSLKNEPIEKSKSGLYGNIPEKLELIPQTDFKWDQIDPLKSYPFKNGIYKLNMGIKNLNYQDWLLIEPTYLNRIENKFKIINNCHPDYPIDKDTRSSTLFITDEAYEAVIEFYNIVMNYMLVKYPTCFSSNETEITNLITNESYPRFGKGINPLKLQEYLVENIEEDFIILLKDPTKIHEKNGEEYFFKAGVFAFAAGFDPLERFNKPLTFIHERIPGYVEKLKLSMNKFFNRISSNQFVTRSNWSIQSHNKFYVDDNNKGHNLPEDHIQKPIPYNEMKFNEYYYRSERQVLTKLPKTEAIVFTIRTYLIPLSEVKAEGKEVRERLIGGIKGFPEDIARYKRASEWGPSIIQYLEEDN